MEHSALVAAGADGGPHEAHDTPPSTWLATETLARTYGFHEPVLINQFHALTQTMPAQQAAEQLNAWLGGGDQPPAWHIPPSWATTNSWDAYDPEHTSDHTHGGLQWPPQAPAAPRYEGSRCPPERRAPRYDPYEPLPPPAPGWQETAPDHHTLTAFLTQVDLADTDTQIHELLSYRLAQHGITSPMLLAQLEHPDLGTMLRQHSKDAAHYPARLQEIAAKARIRTALNSAKAIFTTPLQVSSPQPHAAQDRTAIESLATSQADIAKHLKKQHKRRTAGFIREGGSSSEEDDTFDVTKGLADAGLGHFIRSEYVEPQRMARLSKSATTAINKRRPFVSQNAHKLLSSWVPMSTQCHGAHPDQARRSLTERKSFNSLAHFLRHKTTCLLAHVAVGVLDVPSLLWYLLEIIEFADAHGLEAAIAYDNGRTRQLQSIVDLHSSSVNSAAEQAQYRHQTDIPKCETSDDAKKFMGRFLRRIDHELARDAAQGKIKPQKEPPKDDRDNHDRRDGKNRGAPRDRHRDRSRSKHRRDRQGDRDHKNRDDNKGGKGRGTPQQERPKYICFDHHPATGKKCPNGDSCQKQHLDTKNADDLARYDKAKTAHDSAKARKKQKE